MRLLWPFFCLTNLAGVSVLPPTDEKSLTAYAVPLKVVGGSLQEAESLVRVHGVVGWVEGFRRVARGWVGRPYGSGGQGLGPQELLINLRQMDCMTAVENLLALKVAGEWYQQELFSAEEAFVQALLRIRYESYPPCRWEDRHHYLTHAFVSWEANGWGTWLPLGRPDTRPIRYISSHRERYRGFTDWKRIQAIERALSERPRFWISEEELSDWLPLLQDGDIIAFIPEDPLLDVSHVGVFFWESGKATFAHASLTARQWVWGEDLCAYLDRRSKVIGITVFRPYACLSCGISSR
jgi:hypothetical protein